MLYIYGWLSKAMGKKIALVTGANRGIGFETCRQLSQLGLTVLLTSRDNKKGEAATKQLTDKGLDVVYCQLDVSDKDSIRRVFGRTVQQFGHLDVLVNNAAILYDTFQSATDADLEVGWQCTDNQPVWPLAAV